MDATQTKGPPTSPQGDFDGADQLPDRIWVWSACFFTLIGFQLHLTQVAKK